MKEDNTVAVKSYLFALSVIKAYKEIAALHKEFVLSKQFLRSGTSIGANVREAIGAQSKPDFIAKMSIAYKESLETEYWVRLLRDSVYLDPLKADGLLSQDSESAKIISSILLTSKSKWEN